MSAVTTAPITQSTPPETIEKRRLVNEATRPASVLPSVGPLATWANSIPTRRPRISSGVAVSMIVERKIALTSSAAPATASSTSESQSDSAKPNAAIATPHPHAASTTARPCLRTCGIHPEASEETSAPAYGAA